MIAWSKGTSQCSSLPKLESIIIRIERNNYQDGLFNKQRFRGAFILEERLVSLVGGISLSFILPLVAVTGCVIHSHT